MLNTVDLLLLAIGRTSSLAGGNEDFPRRQRRPPPMEQGQIIQEEHVPFLPLELHALLLDDLAAPLHDVFGYLRPVRHGRRAGLLAMHADDGVEPHAPCLPPREDPSQGPRPQDGRRPAVWEPLDVHSQCPGPAPLTPFIRTTCFCCGGRDG